MSDQNNETDWKQKYAELEALVAEERKKFNAKATKKKTKSPEPAVIDLDHEEEEQIEVKAIQKVDKPEEVNAVTVTAKDIGNELVTIATNAITPLVQAAKDNPTTALAIAGGSTTIGLFVAHKLGITDFNPMMVIENAIKGFKKLGENKPKKQLPFSPSQAVQEDGAPDLVGPCCSLDEMRDALLEQRAAKFGNANSDLIAIDDERDIDRARFKVTNVFGYYKDANECVHRIIIGHKTKSR